MTEIEKTIVQILTTNGMIKLYCTCVNYSLLLMKLKQIH